MKGEKWILDGAVDNYDGHGEKISAEDRIKFLEAISQEKDLDDDDVFFYHQLKGIAWEELGENEKAINCFTKALQNIVKSGRITNNTIVQTLLWRGELYVKANKLDKALEDFKKVYKLEPEKGEGALLEQANVYLRLGDPDKAEACLDELAERKKGAPNFKPFWQEKIKKLRDKIRTRWLKNGNN